MKRDKGAILQKVAISRTIIGAYVVNLRTKMHNIVIKVLLLLYGL